MGSVHGTLGVPWGGRQPTAGVGVRAVGKGRVRDYAGGEPRGALGTHHRKVVVELESQQGQSGGQVGKLVVEELGGVSGLELHHS